MANILQIVQDVADRVGLVRPTALVGVSDNQARQLLAFANQEGHDLARRCAWQALTKEKTFTTVAQESQTGAVPADFDRFVTGTFYNRTKSRVVTGPLTAQEWADYKGRLASVVFDAFRLRGDAILLAPTPSAGETMVYEYVSKYWCGDASDTTPTQSGGRYARHFVAVQEISWARIRAGFHVLRNARGSIDGQRWRCAHANDGLIRAVQTVPAAAA